MLTSVTNELDYPDGSGPKIRLTFNGRARRLEIVQHSGELPVYVDFDDVNWFAEIIEEYATLVEETVDASQAGKSSSD